VQTEEDKPDLHGLLDVAVAGDRVPYRRGDGERGVSEKSIATDETLSAEALDGHHRLAGHQQDEEAEHAQGKEAPELHAVCPPQGFDPDARDRQGRQRQGTVGVGIRFLARRLVYHQRFSGHGDPG
jgi:hypothetical protein